MRLTILALLVPPLGLAACSQSEDASAETATSAPRVSETAAATQPDAPAQAPIVPAKFHGIWDYAKGSCDPASDMRTEIAEHGIAFYESHGAVTGLTLESPDAILVELAMEGEGEKWQDRRRFTLSADGRTLTVTGVDQDEGEPMPLKRCA